MAAREGCGQDARGVQVTPDEEARSEMHAQDAAGGNGPTAGSDCRGSSRNLRGLRIDTVAVAQTVGLSGHLQAGAERVGPAVAVIVTDGFD